MSEQGADSAGNKLALAALIASIMFGTATIIYAVGTVI